ncbi:MAG TPA: hypothetical protein VJB99_00625 [Patescibacteria group bacterium]|nr:hypothetical protein [Patescibacteria group bacterium]
MSCWLPKCWGAKALALPSDPDLLCPETGGNEGCPCLAALFLGLLAQER